MVRILVGTAVRVGRNKLTEATIREWLTHPQARPQNFVAPAEGLVLQRVFYS
jgi:tRNA U38,U39,U40 pseudouridine synthase TruA